MSQGFKKHHFWIFFGVVPLLVFIAVLMLMFGVASSIEKRTSEIDSAKKNVSGVKPKGQGVINDLEKQKEVLVVKRQSLWEKNRDRQVSAGIFEWPQDRADTLGRLKAIEKMNLKFGDKFEINNSENERFTQPAVYEASYTKIADTIAPTSFPNNNWRSALRYVSDWGNRRPTFDLIWLALEDFWVQKALLLPIAEVNKKAAQFTEVKTNNSTKLKKTFQGRVWKIDLEVADDKNGKPVLKSKLTNLTDRLQVYGVGNTMQLKVWFDNPKKTKPFLYRIQGDFVPGSGSKETVVVPLLHNLEILGFPPVEITKVEQIFDSLTVPVRLVNTVELGFVDHRNAKAQLSPPAFLPEPEPTTGTQIPGYEGPGGPGGPGRDGDEDSGDASGGPIGPTNSPFPGGPGSTTAATAGAKTGNALAVLLGNKNRYVEVTEQVRRMPVGISVVADIMYVPDIQTAFVNSPFRFQITQMQWKRFRGQISQPNTGTGYDEYSPEGGYSPDAGVPPGGGGEYPTGPGFEGGDAEDDRGGFIAPPGFGNPYGNPYSSPYGNPFGSPYGSSNSTANSQASAGLVTLGIYGIINIYEKYDASKDPEKQNDTGTTTPGTTTPGTTTPGTTTPGTTTPGTTTPGTTTPGTTTPGTTTPGTTTPGTTTPGTTTPGTTTPGTTIPETKPSGNTPGAPTPGTTIPETKKPN